ncbi:MAG: GNAT family N-acetyltransferase, partial [Halobacillus sp.]
MEIRQVGSPQEKDDAFHVRRVVFVDEQNVPEDLEIDEYDETAVHLVGYEHGEPIAAARLRFV